ncbi:potassium channel family protein [Mycoplasma corogypsi]|uniref:potassium channel family protein n=1 Tax=Mycoplasma corogypsi TaxID=2106 RepID=UPI0038738AEF
MKVKYKDDIAVIGAGRFGQAVIEQLLKLNKNLILIDKVDDEVKKYSDDVDRIIILDAADKKALQASGIDQMETVVVTVTENVEIVGALLELGVKNIIARAKSKRYARVLKLIGVKVIIRPEYEAGIRTAIIAANNSFINYSDNIFELENNFVIGSTKIKNNELTNKPIRDLKLPDFGINIILIKRDGESHMATANGELKLGDTISIVGEISDVTNALELFNREN